MENSPESQRYVDKSCGRLSYRTPREKIVQWLVPRAGAMAGVEGKRIKTPLAVV